MGDLPVATLQPNGSGISIYYIHTDHLGTPRKITQPSSNTLVWRWDPDTFGSLAANQNPAGLGTFVYNLRFPGQYDMPETGIYYNYFRDYDPQTGRYLESDPIGLRGGSPSTYAYVGGNPVGFRDNFGLCACSMVSQEILFGGNWLETMLEATRSAKPTNPMPETQPLPPGWTEDWGWQYPEGLGQKALDPRWTDTEGGEWRYDSGGQVAYTSLGLQPLE